MPMGKRAMLSVYGTGTGRARACENAWFLSDRGLALPFSLFDRLFDGQDHPPPLILQRVMCVPQKQVRYPLLQYFVSPKQAWSSRGFCFAEMDVGIVLSRQRTGSALPTGPPCSSESSVSPRSTVPRAKSLSAQAPGSTPMLLPSTSPIKV